MTDEARLRASSAEIERLVGELEELTTPAAWLRVQQVLARVTALYGAGLERAIECARAEVGDRARYDARIAADELLASLLVLHGLHPVAVEDRVRGALEAARAELGLAADQLALVELRDGTVHLQVTGSLGGAMSPALASRVIERAIESAAPEIVGVTGLPVPQDPGLVQIRRRA